jgi:hypothetical protein
MIKNVLQEIGGLGVYALTSLLLFFTVFTGALIWTLLQRASFCSRMESLPLEDENSSPTKREEKLL